MSVGEGIVYIQKVIFCIKKFGLFVRQFSVELLLKLKPFSV